MEENMLIEGSGNTLKANPINFDDGLYTNIQSPINDAISAISKDALEQKEKSQSKKITLVLHLDVNQTVTVFESVGQNSSLSIEESQKEVISRILSKRHVWSWGHDKTKFQTFYDYIICSPNLSKAEKRERVNHFVSYVPDEVYSKVMKDYEHIQKCLEGKLVFRSVIKLIKYLRAEEIDFHIVLRSFGPDGNIVGAHIERELPNEKFNMTAKLKYPNVELNRNIKDDKPEFINTLSASTSTLYNYLKAPDYTHATCIDDHAFWSSNNEKAETGKPIPVNFDDAEIIVVAGDDNIETDPNSKTNIMFFFDAKSGNPIPMKTLLDRKWAIAVDPYDAMTDENYYLNAVYQAFQSVGKSFGSLSNMEAQEVFYV